MAVEAVLGGVDDIVKYDTMKKCPLRSRWYDVDQKGGERVSFTVVKKQLPRSKLFQSHVANVLSALSGVLFPDTR